jgi:hypothetical protein
MVTAQLNISLNAKPGIHKVMIEVNGDIKDVLNRSTTIADRGSKGEGRNNGETAHERTNPMNTCIQKNSKNICMVLRTTKDTIERKIPRRRCN